MSEARTMERGTDSAKRQAKDEVPGDRIKDAPALARELRWRVRHAAGYSSDDDGRSHRGAKTKSVANGEPTMNGSNSKRKRSAMDTGEDSAELFRNFKRPEWEHVEERPTERATRVVKVRRPASQGWAEDWARGTDELLGGDDGESAQVESRRDVIVKVRRTAKGLERQRVERVLEEWVWDGGNPADAPSAPAKTEAVDVTMGEDGPHAAASADDAHEDTRMEEGSPVPSDADTSSGAARVGMVNGSSGAVPDSS